MPVMLYDLFKGSAQIGEPVGLLQEKRSAQQLCFLYLFLIGRSGIYDNGHFLQYRRSFYIGQALLAVYFGHVQVKENDIRQYSCRGKLLNGIFAVKGCEAYAGSIYLLQSADKQFLVILVVIGYKENTVFFHEHSDISKGKIK
jgi:hypothetical protein